ncbi:MAG: DUF308 domain-containing protein [Christensenellaceae bacterium]|nr:DUF308 domain-containing protein [Christensenellaceae bacterium]
MRSSRFRVSKPIAVFVMIIALIVLVCGAASLIKNAKEYKEYNSSEVQNFKMLSDYGISQKPYVEGQISFVIDAYSDDQASNLGIRLFSGSKVFYWLIPLFDDHGMIESFITLEAPAKYWDTLAQICQETWSVDAPSKPTTLYITDAKIDDLHPVTRGMLEYWCEQTEFYENGDFIDWCIESDLFGTSERDVILSKLLPYMIVMEAKPSLTGSAIATLVGIMLCVAGIILLHTAKVQEKAAMEQLMQEWG